MFLKKGCCFLFPLIKLSQIITKDGYVYSSCCRLALNVVMPKKMSMLALLRLAPIYKKELEKIAPSAAMGVDIERGDKYGDDKLDE